MSKNQLSKLFCQHELKGGRSTGVSKKKTNVFILVTREVLLNLSYCRWFLITGNSHDQIQNPLYTN
jgi:hypothetical protein